MTRDDYIPPASEDLPEVERPAAPLTQAALIGAMIGIWLIGAAAALAGPAISACIESMRNYQYAQTVEDQP